MRGSSCSPQEAARVYIVPACNNTDSIDLCPPVVACVPGAREKDSVDNGLVACPHRCQPIIKAEYILLHVSSGTGFNTNWQICEVIMY